MGGLNQAGVVIELMWLDDTEYPARDQRSPLTVLEWIQYQLDTAASVADVIASDARVRIQGQTPLHYLVGDRSGGTATIEFLEWKARHPQGCGPAVYRPRQPLVCEVQRICGGAGAQSRLAVRGLWNDFRERLWPCRPSRQPVRPVHRRRRWIAHSPYWPMSPSAARAGRSSTNSPLASSTGAPTGISRDDFSGWRM